MRKVVTFTFDHNRNAEDNSGQGDYDQEFTDALNDAIGTDQPWEIVFMQQLPGRRGKTGYLVVVEAP